MKVVSFIILCMFFHNQHCSSDANQEITTPTHFCCFWSLAKNQVSSPSISSDNPQVKLLKPVAFKYPKNIIINSELLKQLHQSGGQLVFCLANDSEQLYVLSGILTATGEFVRFTTNNS